MRVLIAEDDAGVRSVLERGLTEEGYVCDTATQGDDALHLLRIYDYAAAVLDWRMPGLTGEEVAREARKLKIRTPILMLTARDTIADKVQGLDAGADDYLVKPFQFEELLARLRALLRRPPEVEEPVLGRGRLAARPPRPPGGNGGGPAGARPRAPSGENGRRPRGDHRRRFRHPRASAPPLARHRLPRGDRAARLAG